mmetsp:Transcript_41787/g.103860  ORF Transcript_41787/g.103860 Transcript_41787/m.103860 type:complete len:116 (+) Transcript_41787:1014-1361(+)
MGCLPGSRWQPGNAIAPPSIALSVAEEFFGGGRLGTIGLELSLFVPSVRSEQCSAPRSGGRFNGGVSLCPEDDADRVSPNIVRFGGVGFRSSPFLRMPLGGEEAQVGAANSPSRL